MKKDQPKHCIRLCKHYQATATSARNIYVVLRISHIATS